MAMPFTRGYGQTVASDQAAGQGPATLSTGAIVGIAVGALVVLLLLAGLAWYLFVYRKRKAGASRARELTARHALAETRVDVPELSTGTGTTGSGAPGLSSGVAVMTGSDAPGPSSGGAVITGSGCRMCRAGYGGERPVVVLECGHSFHRRCIRRWLVHNQSCPTCNATHIALLGVPPQRSDWEWVADLQARRRSVDDAASFGDDLVVEIRRSRSSRW